MLTSMTFIILFISTSAVSFHFSSPGLLPKAVVTMVTSIDRVLTFPSLVPEFEEMKVGSNTYRLAAVSLFSFCSIKTNSGEFHDNWNEVTGDYELEEPKSNSKLVHNSSIHIESSIMVCSLLFSFLLGKHFSGA